LQHTSTSEQSYVSRDLFLHHLRLLNSTRKKHQKVYHEETEHPKKMNINHRNTGVNRIGSGRKKTKKGRKKIKPWVVRGGGEEREGKVKGNQRRAGGIKKKKTRRKESSVGRC